MYQASWNRKLEGVPFALIVQAARVVKHCDNAPGVPLSRVKSRHYGVVVIK
jgi:hypothetical protein